MKCMYCSCTDTQACEAGLLGCPNICSSCVAAAR